MAFREKNVEQVVQDLLFLSVRYGIRKFSATDWILSRRQCNELFERLADLDLDLDIFFEVRADIPKAQMMRMKAAGVLRTQPGIEALCTPLLRHMRKGTTVIRHLQFMRHAKEIGVDISYNLLCRFPDERDEWYEQMAAIVPAIAHLQPPLHNVQPIELHRFSPLFEQWRGRDALELTVRGDYSSNFPAGAVDLAKVAYFYERPAGQSGVSEETLEKLKSAVGQWIDGHREANAPVCEYTLGPDFIKITDTRFGQCRDVQLRDMHRDVLLLCDSLQKEADLASSLSRKWGIEHVRDALPGAIRQLVAERLLYEEDGKLLALPTGKKARSSQRLKEVVFGRGHNMSSQQFAAVA